MRATAVAWIVNAAILGGIAGFAAGRFVVDSWGISGTVAALGTVVLAATWLIAPFARDPRPHTRRRRNRLIPCHAGLSVRDQPGVLSGYGQRSTKKHSEHRGRLASQVSRPNWMKRIEIPDHSFSG